MITFFQEKQNMSFQARLKELREASKLSQGELAERANMSRGGIAQLETGRRKPGWETLQKLATALGVSIDAFAEEAASEEKKGPGRPKGKSNAN